MTPKITASRIIIQELSTTMDHARQSGNVSMFNRIQALIGVLSGVRYEDIAITIGVSTESIRIWVNAFLLNGIESVLNKKYRGRSSKLTKSQKRELKKGIDNGPEPYGYTSGCWRSAMVQDYIYKKFGVFYSVYYIAELLKNIGLSYQKARFVSAHLDPEKRDSWLKKTWPRILRLSKNVSSYLLFGDESSFPQWGSLSYTWASKGKQPVIKTSGKRRGYKVFGMIDYWIGKFFLQGN